MTDKMKITKLLANNFFLIVLVLVFSFLFFYRLDWNTLVSWDEAWYGTIARNMLQKGDFIYMVWKDRPYYDHPPMGFWLMAASYKIFGVNEFSTRFPSAFLGLLSILLIYVVSCELFKNRLIGFVSALVLGTSVWYLIRVRSGNLDSIFIFFYILTIFLALKSSRNFKWFPATMASFGGLILSKTLVGFSAGILIIFLTAGQLIKLKKNWWLTLLAIIVLLTVAYPWYYFHIKTNPLFIQEHFIITGMRNKPLASYFKLNATLPLFYLHMGVRKWYYIWLISLAFLTITFKFLKKPIFFILLWNLIVLYPFLTSDKTEIWHLIPVYLPIALLIASGVYCGLETIIDFVIPAQAGIQKRLCRFLIKSGMTLKKSDTINCLFLLTFLFIASIQIKNFYFEVYPRSKYIPDDVDISKRVAKYKQKIYLDDDFAPIAFFYSNRKITPVNDLLEDKRTMLKFFQSDEKDFVMITRNWAIDNLVVAKMPYKILEKNNSFSIVSRP